jgi:hypothetical protein
LSAVELLNEAVPGLRRIAVRNNPGNASPAPRTKEIAEAAKTLKLQRDHPRIACSAS